MCCVLFATTHFTQAVCYGWLPLLVAESPRDKINMHNRSHSRRNGVSLSLCVTPSKPSKGMNTVPVPKCTQQRNLDAPISLSPSGLFSPNRCRRFLLLRYRNANTRDSAWKGRSVPRTPRSLTSTSACTWRARETRLPPSTAL